jgi:hypothetical protein
MAITWEFPARIEIPSIISSSVRPGPKFHPLISTFVQPSRPDPAPSHDIRSASFTDFRNNLFSQTKYTSTPNMSSLPDNGNYKIKNVGTSLYLAVDQTANTIILKADSSTDTTIRVWTDSICQCIFPSIS